MMLLDNAPADTGNAAEIEAIRESGMFDAAFYQSKAGPQPDPILHYLTEGESRNIPPSEFFDPEFYRLTNPDVAKAGVSLLLHYICYGRQEGRYARPRDLATDVEKVEKSGLFDPPTGFDFSIFSGDGSTATTGFADLAASFSPIQRYLVGWRFGARANEVFDDIFYARTYEDLVEYGKPPIIHYLEVGQRQHRPINQARLAGAVAEIQNFFDAEYYRQQTSLPPTIDPVTHYLTIGRFRGLDPAPNFSVSYYLSAYPDIARAGVDPFAHFLKFRHREKRVGRPSFTENLVVGARSYNPEWPTVLIVNHDASRTGAPLVGLETARHLCRDHNVLIYSMKDGWLIEEFSRLAVQVNVGPAKAVDAEYFFKYLKTKYRLDAVILNSAETSVFATAALYEGIPSVALIHEFAEYTLPPGRTSKIVATADRVVVPADLILDSVQREVEWQFGARSPNLAIHPQGCLPALPARATNDGADLTADEILARLNASPDAKPPVVLGAGFVHMRKGVDLFVQTAQEVRRRVADVKFIWVGDGYAPKTDTTYSVWLAETVRRLSLENTVLFLPPQSQLDELFTLCDVFFLSSRLDPFPSVVLDAFEAGKQVVCFEQATGAAELLKSGKARGAVVEYANTAAAAKAIIGILEAPQDEAARVNRSLINQAFRFEDYVSFLKQQIEQARACRAEANKIRDRIRASNAFDAEFHEGGSAASLDADKACDDYVARATKTLEKFNPRPGFSDGLYRSQNKLQPGEVPLDHAWKHNQDGPPPATHRCVVLSEKVPRLSPGSRIALHIHLFYADLAGDFVGRLNAAGYPIDVFLTTTDEAKQEELTNAFAEYTLGQVRVVKVANRGRDIGPLLTDLVQPLVEGHYDIVGHLHGKRSLDVDPAMGERWRAFLLNTLLGDKFSHLLSLFTTDKKLGLVFAEDRHAAGWNANQEIAKGLAERTTPKLKLPIYPYFPLGTMFWARPAALEPLWALKLRREDFPAEPVAYDGTILHALERVLPACCEAAGLNWCTVHDRRYSW